MKAYLRKKRNECLSRSTSRKHEYKNLEDISCILLVYEAKYHQAVSEFANKLKQLGKEVVLLSDSDIKTNWLGMPKQDFLQSLRGKTYDLVMDISTEVNDALLCTILNLDTPFKVGYQKSSLSAYDLSIQLPSADEHQKTAINPVDIGNHIVHYLQQIKTKK